MPASPPRAGRSVALVGMPGAGKSEAGRMLARRLRLPFADSDCEIERAAGRTIGEIFAAEGEAAFREAERRTLERLTDGPRRIVAAGGGAFAEPATRAMLRARCLTVWLDAPPEILAERLAGRGERPLLAGGDLAGRLRALAEARRPAYAEAELRVDASGSAEATVEALLGTLAERAE